MQMYIPPEVWDIIFRQVQAQSNFTSSYDLLNASQACRKFQEILAPTKCIWLFKEIFPFLLSPLKYRKKYVLRLRLVCKTWKDAVDHVLGNHEHYLSKLKSCNYHATKFYQNGVVPFCHPLRDVRALTHLHKVETLERILQTGNFSFPGRGVIVYTKHATDEYKIRFYNLLTDVLLKYGDNILYLELEDSAYPAVNFKQFLCQHLNLLPNLKFLSLVLYCVSDVAFSLSAEAHGVSLPKLPQLETLEFTNMFQPGNEMPILNVEFSQDLCLSFFPNNMHIKKFQIDGLHFSLPFNQYLKPIKDNIFLTDIRMKLYSQKEFTRLLSLLSITSLLKSVIVYCVGNQPHWKPGAGILVLDKLLSSIDARHYKIEILRIFCQIPSTSLMSNITEFIPECTIILGQLRKLKRLRCLHLYGFTFMHQRIIAFLPHSLSCLALDCVNYTEVIRNTRHTFCFPIDLIRVHKDDEHYTILHVRIDICPKKVWARFPQLKQICLRTISERLDDQDTLGHLMVFHRPVNVDRLVEQNEQDKNEMMHVAQVLVFSFVGFIVISFVILVLFVLKYLF